MGTPSPSGSKATSGGVLSGLLNLCTQISGSRPGGDLRSRVESQLVADVLDVTLRRSLRQVEALGDASVGKAVRDQHGDLELPPGERMACHTPGFDRSENRLGALKPWSHTELPADRLPVLGQAACAAELLRTTAPQEQLGVHDLGAGDVWRRPNPLLHGDRSFVVPDSLVPAFEGFGQQPHVMRDRTLH